MMDPVKIEAKFTITDAAADVFVQNNGSFTIRETAQKLDIEPREIFNYFHDKQSVLRFYYTSLIFRYEVMIEEIEDFNSYTISEKLSSFIFSTFDMLSEKQSFVEATYKPLILYSTKSTGLEQEVQRLFRKFLYEDKRLPAGTVIVMNSFLYSYLRRQYLLLIRYWLNDETPGKERTMELVDKLTGLLEELLYNTVLDKTVDLIKFLAADPNTRITDLTKLPGIKQVLSNIEIR